MTHTSTANKPKACISRHKPERIYSTKAGTDEDY